MPKKQKNAIATIMANNYQENPVPNKAGRARLSQDIHGKWVVGWYLDQTPEQKKRRLVPAYYTLREDTRNKVIAKAKDLGIITLMEGDEEFYIGGTK